MGTEQRPVSEGAVACAALGECTKNAAFMLGSEATEGHCRLACGACTPCDEHDSECIASSRAVQGYLNITPEEMAQIFPS